MATRGLRITRARARSFDGRSELSLDPDLRVFVTDLARPYGLPVREDLLRAGAGHSYEEMAAGLLREELADDEPVDLLILAFDSPDVRPGAPSSLALSRSCPGSPLAFAVCDQGLGAAFTALRLAAEYHRTGFCRRAVVVVAEQTALHYAPGAPVRLPQRHGAVVLVCEEAPGGAMDIRQTPCTDDPEKEVRALAGSLDPGTVLVRGPGVDGPTAQPFTGVWAELAEGLPQRRPVLVASFDRRLGVLNTLALP
ncbi:hypothetical protein AB0C76_02460 [Kitasatospora sp. NPDC048722]|uniref:hypothetical protein n=1 Tax=Kitasatospora sp. NPDC048722 TaxID=3155639 RepID=UPI0033FF06FD